MTLDAFVRQLAESTTSTRYRIGENGLPEHQCTKCLAWKPATILHFGAASSRALKSHCRPCSGNGKMLAKQREAKAEDAEAQVGLRSQALRTRAEHAAALGEDMVGVAECRLCGAEHPRTDQFFVAARDGRLTHTCRDCSGDLRARATKRAAPLVLED